MSKQAKHLFDRRSRFAMRKLATGVFSVVVDMSSFYHLKRLLRLKKSLKQVQRSPLVNLKM